MGEGSHIDILGTAVRFPVQLFAPSSFPPIRRCTRHSSCCTYVVKIPVPSKCFEENFDYYPQFSSWS